MSEKEINKIMRAHLRFLKNNDALNKYMKEYKYCPNSFNHGNILKDLILSIETSPDKSGFHMRHKGFNRYGSIFGETFWEKIDHDFKYYYEKFL